MEPISNETFSNLASVQNILGLKEDINEAPRAYLNQQEVSIPTNSDLKIGHFMTRLCMNQLVRYLIQLIPIWK